MLRKKVMICDDDQDVSDTFKANHQQEFDVMSPLTKVEDLFGTLKDLKELPDLLVLDLYWPNDLYKRDKERVDKIIKPQNDAFIRMAADIRALDRQFHDPTGLKELERIARSFPDMAVVLYSRTGSYTLDDSDMQKAYKLDAGFLSKEENSAFRAGNNAFGHREKGHFQKTTGKRS